VLSPTFRPRAFGTRGFTLAEVLAVLAIMSILAVTASPTFVRLMRDRRVNRAAMHLVDSYRMGRTRAMGRGQPMLVRWDPGSGLNNAEPGGKGLIQVLEPVVTAATSATNCASTNWAAAREVSRIDFKNGRYTYTTAQLLDDTGPPGTAQGFADVCFTPAGNAYVRYASTASFRQMTGVVSFTVTNSFTSVNRTVFVPPNGVARLQL
jgi:type IV fimbrial biogenesis protein FimT